MIHSLKNKKKIEVIFDKGSIIKGNGVFLKYYDFEDGLVQYGVSVSKKVFSSAVKRNLIKRRVREQVKALSFTSLISKGVSFFLIYTSKDILSSKEIKKSLEGVAQKL
jgi:ribonuclease P protein component